MKLDKEKLTNILTGYLDCPEANPIWQHEHHAQVMFFLSVLGYSFIEGYRVFERRGCQLFMLSAMYYHPDVAGSNEKRTKKLEDYAQYRLINFQFDDQFSSGEYRSKLYQQLLTFLEFFEGEVQIHVMHVNNGKYAILNRQELQNCVWPDCKPFYRKINFLNAVNGKRPMHQKIQGKLLHELVEIFIKGHGQPRNAHVIAKLQHQNKFSYDLFKVLNTVSLILGKQFLQNNYQTMTAEKWMRKTTQKKFRRLDVVLRNEIKCCIIDWKFSQSSAENKISDRRVNLKNMIYYQLASKDFLTNNVELKFYCIHARSSQHYHDYSVAMYRHQIEEVELDPIQLELESEEFQFTEEEIYILQGMDVRKDMGIYLGKDQGKDLGKEVSLEQHKKSTEKKVYRQNKEQEKSQKKTNEKLYNNVIDILSDYQEKDDQERRYQSEDIHTASRASYRNQPRPINSDIALKLLQIHQKERNRLLRKENGEGPIVIQLDGDEQNQKSWQDRRSQTEEGRPQKKYFKEE